MIQIITLIFTYFVFSFVNWDYNPANWEAWVRVFFFIVYIAWIMLKVAFLKCKAQDERK